MCHCVYVFIYAVEIKSKFNIFSECDKTRKEVVYLLTTGWIVSKNTWEPNKLQKNKVLKKKT